MIIATDGASRRNGQITCTSMGVAFIGTEDGDFFYLAEGETCSTNQRGEINGLLSALKYAAENRHEDEDVIVISDSEYLCNTIGKDWLHKWANNNWIGSTGTVKNMDKWQQILVYVDEINKHEEHLFMQWIKGHLISYTDGNIRNAMRDDSKL